MEERENGDGKLVEQTIARLLDFQGVETTGRSDVAAPGSPDEPSDLGHAEIDTITREVVGQTPWEQFDQEIRQKRLMESSRVHVARRRTMKLLVPVLSVILLVCLNKFHGVPSFGGNWLRFGTYRNMFGDYVKSGVPTAAGVEHPIKLQVRGIAFSHDKPSAVIGTTIVHEGDIVSGATVVRIDRDSVEFEINGHRWTQRVQ